MSHPAKPPIQPLRQPYDTAVYHPQITQQFGNIAPFEPAVLDFHDHMYGWVWEAGATQKNMHTGRDFGLAGGVPILAAAAGRVIACDPPAASYGFGNLTVLEHSGGLLTFYAHQQRFGCSVGQYLSVGQVLGYVGTTGNSSGNHLHFAAGAHDGYGYYCFTDPAPYLDAQSPEEYPTAGRYRVLVDHFLRTEARKDAPHGAFVTVGQILDAVGGPNGWTTSWRLVEGPDGWAAAQNLAAA